MVNSKLKHGLAALAITGLVITFLLVREEQTRLANENAALRLELAHAWAEYEALSNLVLQTKSPGPPAASPSPELLRLSGEVKAEKRGEGRE